MASTDEEPAEPGLRERKKASVRSALVAVAMKLFARKGFDGVTVDELAAAAKVSRRTFFRYFPTKEAVVLARREALLETFRASLEQAPRNEAGYLVLRRLLLSMAEHYVEERVLVLEERALLRANPSLLVRDLELDRTFEASVLEALLARSKRTLTDRRRAKIAAAAVVGAVRVVLDEWADSEGSVDLQALGRQALELLQPLLEPAQTAARSS